MRTLKVLLIVLCGVLLVGGCQVVRNSAGTGLQPAADNVLRIATYNVHYIVLSRQQGNWGTEHWQQRKAPLNRIFQSLEADIVAFQEMESFAGGNDGSINLVRDWLEENNPDYATAAVGDWRSFPSTQPILYRHAKYRLEDQGWFFFSETPDVIYSRTYNGSYPAFASWAQFIDRATGNRFRVVNIHTDYASRENRRRSIDLVAQRVQPWLSAGQAVLVTGDFNARLGSSLHRTLETAGLAFAPVKGSTYHFNRGLNLFGAIDHIAYSAELVLIGEPVVVREKSGDTWPTDHYPVVADFSFKH